MPSSLAERSLMAAVDPGQNASIGAARRFSSQRSAAEPRAERFRSPELSEWLPVHGAQLDYGSAFLVNQLLAAEPELGAQTPRIATTLAAYQAQSSSRIAYSGPITPVDLSI